MKTLSKDCLVKAPRRWSVATLRDKAMFAWESEDSGLLWNLADAMAARRVSSLSGLMLNQRTAEAIKRVAKNEKP